VNIFLDSSVNLAAAGSDRGASRMLFINAARNGISLQTSQYVLNEVEYNLSKFPASAQQMWAETKSQLVVVADIVQIAWPTILLPAKDRPVLYTALAWSDVLLTLDRRHFSQLIGTTFYGLPVETPGQFVAKHRTRFEWSY
jgi:hypothetical protein